MARVFRMSTDQVPSEVTDAVERDLLRILALFNIRQPSKVVRSAAVSLAKTAINANSKPAIAYKQKKANLSKYTEWMIASQVGAVVEVDKSYSASNLKNNMRTARKLMGNEDAKWHRYMIGTTQFLKRVADGKTVMREPQNNPRAMFIASIPVGQSKLFPSELMRQTNLDPWTKQVARAILGDQSANWRQQKFNTGVRIYRIA